MLLPFIISLLVVSFDQTNPNLTSMKRIDLIKTGGSVAGEHLVTNNDDLPLPSNDRQQVVIKVKASAVNPVDWKMAEFNFFLPPTPPAALGCDVAGVVVQGGSNMMGKRVVTYLGANKVNHATSRGAFASHVVADADLVVEIPDDMTFAQAASLPVGALTAELLLKELPPTTDYVIVWGASSSVGYNAVQLAIKRGWKTIAVASGKHETSLQELGISGFVDYRKANVMGKVKEICGNNKLNGAVDCIGDPTTFSTCCELVAGLGDSSLSLAVSTVSPYGLPDPPAGINKCPVDLGTALDDSERRELVQKWMPEIVHLKPMPIRSIKGQLTAATVQEAFQISKEGVSGEKVVIERICYDQSAEF